MRSVIILKYRKLWRLSIIPIVPGLYHQLYTNQFVNSSLVFGWFAGNIYGIRQEGDGNIYYTLFEYGDTEEWRQDKCDNNAADACIPIGDVRFRFTKKFADGSFFSGLVFGIQSNDKHKCKFDEYGDINKYTFDQLQAYSTNQTAVYNYNYNEFSLNNGSDDGDEGNGDNENDANESAEK